MTETVMVIAYALMRWARGEEAAAQKGAIDRAFHSINLTCWLRILAAAMAGAIERCSLEPDKHDQFYATSQPRKAITNE